MYLKSFFMLRKFQKRIFIWIILAFVTILLVFSIFAYFNMERIVLEKVYETNIEILSQVKFNVELMDNAIKNLCKELFINTDVSELMYSKNIDTFESLSKMKNIELLIISNPFLDSVYIYNSNTGTIYSPGKSITTNKELLKHIVDIEKTIPILKPIVLDRSIEGNAVDGESKVLSYFMYKYMDTNHIPDGALIINIRTSWLLNNLEQINNKMDTGKIFVFNEEGTYINDEINNNEPPSYIIQLFGDYKKGSLDEENKNGYIERKINGKANIINFLRIESAGLVLIRTQSYDDAFGLFTKMRIALVLITLIFLIIVFVVSILISKAIYKPLGSFVSMIGNGRNAELKIENVTDEMHYLEEVYRLSKNKLKEYENDKISSRNTLKEFYLKKLLLNSSAFNKMDTDQWFIENNISLQVDGGFCVCILRIDGYKEFIKTHDSNDRTLIKFAIINITTELISAKYKSEGIDMDDDKVVLIINAEDKSEKEEIQFSSLEMFIKQAQEYILNHFSASISAAFSTCSKSLYELTELYKEAHEFSNYRLVYGKMSFISPYTVMANKQNEYSFDYEKMLTEGIKSGSSEKLENVLQRLFKETIGFNYKSIIVSMLLIIEIIEKSVSDINSVSLEPVDVDFISMKQSIFEIDTLDEFFRILSEQLKKLCEKREKNIINVKHMLISEEVKEMINNEFFNSTLCLTSIASRLKLSAGYLGKIFKDSFKMSINEYINEVRINKAVEWLKKSDITISEIIVKIGIENETYFYSLFKKKFGVTPKEYMLQEGIKSKN